MQSRVETKRLFLELLRAEDYEFIISLLNSKGWIEFIGDRNVHSKEEAIAYIHKILNTKNFYYWVVRTKEGALPIGIVSFLKRDYLESFDLGFAFLPAFTGKGYAHEAAREILSVVSATGAYSPVLATTVPGNASSIKLLTKLGFRFEQERSVGTGKLHLYSTSGKSGS